MFFRPEFDQTLQKPQKIGVITHMSLWSPRRNWPDISIVLQDSSISTWKIQRSSTISLRKPSTPLRNPIQEPGLLARLRLRVFGWAKRVGGEEPEAPRGLWFQESFGVKRLQCLFDQNIELISFPMLLFMHPQGVPQRGFLVQCVWPPWLMLRVIFTGIRWHLYGPWTNACKIPAMLLYSPGVCISCQCQLRCVRPCCKIALRWSQMNIELHCVFSMGGHEPSPIWPWFQSNFFVL